MCEGECVCADVTTARCVQYIKYVCTQLFQPTVFTYVLCHQQRQVIAVSLILSLQPGKRQDGVEGCHGPKTEVF